jgi:hypothetical protein
MVLFDLFDACLGEMVKVAVMCLEKAGALSGQVSDEADIEANSFSCGSP